MKYLVRVIAIKGRGDFEFEAESVEEAKAKFIQFAEQQKNLPIQAPPPGQEVFIEIVPVTDVVGEQKLILPAEENKSNE